MAKFYGDIGFSVMSETSTGIWEEVIKEHKYYGNITKAYARHQSDSEQLNDNLYINNVISIIADSYASANFSSIRYVKYMGTKWKVTNAEVQYPRLILTLGGMYNGN